MKNELLDISENPHQPQTAVEPNKQVVVEKILEGHCRLMTAIHKDQTPQERLIAMLRRVYRRGKDNELVFENFSSDFQTQEIKEALEAFTKRKKK